GPPQGHQACRVRAAWHQSTGGAADAGDAVVDPRAQEASSFVDESPLHPSDRAHHRAHRGHDPSRRSRHSPRQPDGAAQGHQRFGRDVETAVPRAADAPGQAVLPVSMRPDFGLVAFPHERRQGAGDHPGPARAHHGLCRADLCDRRARRRRQTPAHPALCRRPRGRRPDPEEFRGQYLPLHRPRRDRRRRSADARRASLMRIALVYDLRDEYRALGYSEEEIAEFDSVETIAHLAAALAALGCEPVRVGRGQALAARLVAGERFDLVFSIAEGLKGRSREAQVPALCELFEQPYLFSDPLTAAAALDKAVAKRLGRDAGVKTPAFAVAKRSASELAGWTDFPAFVKPLAEGTGTGCEAAAPAL